MTHWSSKVRVLMKGKVGTAGPAGRGGGEGGGKTGFLKNTSVGGS